jgi:hypothetical protein
MFEELTAMNLAPSGLRDAPPSSLKCIGVGIVNCFVMERSAIFKNITCKMIMMSICEIRSDSHYYKYQLAVIAMQLTRSSVARRMVFNTGLISRSCITAPPLEMTVLMAGPL